jgi:hypothetical protein
MTVVDLTGDDVAVVDRTHPQFVFHDPDKLASLVGMDSEFVADLVEDGLEPCSKCYGRGADTPADVEVRL